MLLTFETKELLEFPGTKPFVTSKLKMVSIFKLRFLRSLIDYKSPTNLAVLLF